MELGEYRPILSGLLGGLIAALVCTTWAQWLPKGLNGKAPSTLLLQHRWAIRLSNGASLAGLCLTLAMYRWGGFASNDWRPVALGAGAALSAPLVVLPLVAIARRCAVAEAYIAFALNQRTPVAVLYPLLLLGIPLLAVAAVCLW